VLVFVKRYSLILFMMPLYYNSKVYLVITVTFMHFYVLLELWFGEAVLKHIVFSLSAY